MGFHRGRQERNSDTFQLDGLTGGERQASCPSNLTLADWQVTMTLTLTVADHDAGEGYTTNYEELWMFRSIRLPSIAEYTVTMSRDSTRHLVIPFSRLGISQPGSKSSINSSDQTPLPRSSFNVARRLGIIGIGLS